MVRIAFAALFIMQLALASGCNSALANKAVQAHRPTIHSDDRQVIDMLKPYRTERDYRFDVGPPDATIAVSVVDPLQTNGSLAFETAGRMLKILRRPVMASTQPTTGATTNPRLKGTVFILHGIANSKDQAPYQLWAAALNGAGYRIVLLDLRAHGQSTGKYLTYGVVEKRDLSQVLDDLEQRGEIVGQVGVLGASYGGAVAIEWAAVEPRLKAVVSLEPFSDFHHAVFDVAPTVLGRWRIFYPPSRIEKIIHLAGKRAGFKPEDASALDAIKRCDQPVLLIHGADDTLLPLANSERLHAAAPSHSKLVIVPGAGHIDLWLHGFDEVFYESTKWFAKYLN